jgi:hypothetical protein
MKQYNIFQKTEEEEKKFLFEQEELDWKQQWKEMPEFVQLNKEPLQKIVINFQTYDDVKEFAKLLGFKVTNKTKSMWFPIKQKDKPREYSYVDTDK